MPRRSRRTQLFAVVASAIVLSACSASESVTGVAAIEPAPYRVTLEFTDEAGDRIERGIVEIDGMRLPLVDGEIVVEKFDPVVAVTTVEGFLVEPIIVSRSLGERHNVGLTASHNADGTPRIAIHFAGDAMMGRRYLEPKRTGTPDISGQNGDVVARSIVSDIAPLFDAADLASVNLETVIGDFAVDEAYPEKRYLIQSPETPTLAMLDELGADLVALGNNHAYDWMDPGIVSTVEALNAAGFAHAGAGLDAERAGAAARFDVNGLDVAMLSYTTVNGSWVNARMPRLGDPRPDELLPTDEWQFAIRTFAYGAPGDEIYLAPTEMRAGDAWAWYHEHVIPLADAAEAPIWAAVTAPGAFPELLDTAARRGHGGAARWARSHADRAVAELRADGVDIVAIQIHGGSQFSAAPSDSFTSALHGAIDAGADVAIGHHPHVTQGFETYRGKLVAFSIGNFVFDQDFMATFPSLILRTVFEGDELLDAKVYPALLVDYRPVPVADDAAVRILRALDAQSSSASKSKRLSDGSVATVPREPAEAVESVHVAQVGNTGVIRLDRPYDELRLRIGTSGVADVPLGGLVRADERAAGLEFGRDLFGYGDFDDWAADGVSRGAMQWALDRGGTVDVPVASSAGDRVLELTSSRGSGVLVRPVARVMRRDHALVTDTEEPADGAATYSVRMQARFTGTTDAYIRVDAYHFDDSAPTFDPINDVVRQVEVALDVPPDGVWHTVEVQLPGTVFAPDAAGRQVNAGMLYLGVHRGEGVLTVDEVKFIEWRRADEFPLDTWQVVDAIRGEPETNGVTLTVS